MSIFIRGKLTDGVLYAQVVENRRKGDKIIQDYIGSLGKMYDLIKNLQKKLQNE